MRRRDGSVKRSKCNYSWNVVRCWWMGSNQYGNWSYCLCSNSNNGRYGCVRSYRYIYSTMCSRTWRCVVRCRSHLKPLRRFYRSSSSNRSYMHRGLWCTKHMNRWCYLNGTYGRKHYYICKSLDCSKRIMQNTAVTVIGRTEGNRGVGIDTTAL